MSAEGLLIRVLIGSKKMQRDIGPITHHPTGATGRPRGNVKPHSSAQLVDRRVLHRGCRTARKHRSHVLDVAARRAHTRPCVKGALPSWLVGARPIVMLPMRTSSKVPVSNVRTSSGSSKPFRTVSIIGISPDHPPRKRKLRRWPFRNREN